MLLNLGHTFGHALEAWAGYSDRLLHGEAIAIGMALAFRFSGELGLSRRGNGVARVEAHFARRRAADAHRATSRAPKPDAATPA